MKTLSTLEMNPDDVKDVILSLTPLDFCNGPLEDHAIAGQLWEFGKVVKVRDGNARLIRIPVTMVIIFLIMFIMVTVVIRMITPHSMVIVIVVVIGMTVVSMIMMMIKGVTAPESKGGYC